MLPVEPVSSIVSDGGLNSRDEGVVRWRDRTKKRWVKARA